MKLWIGIIALSLLFLFSDQCKSETTSEKIVTVDFSMAEKAIDWLEYINTGADEKEIKEYFYENVAPTKGCQSIIKHWARFMEWDNDKFYKFIMEGLDRIPSERPLENDDGSLTAFGRRKMLWLAAIENPEILRDDIIKLKKINLVDTSQTLAKMYLPDDANIENDFYFVLFGGSNAFSIGKENGFDILQLSKNSDGTINTVEVLLLLAHEMHHSGFLSSDKVDLGDNLLLLGVLAAEGMPTYFINKTIDKIEIYKNSHDPILRDLARQWETHLARMPQIYIEAEEDLKSNFDEKIGQKEIWAKWMDGLQGQAYALGSDMFSVVDKYLGLDSARIIPYDNRQFLRIYNNAAQIGNEQGGNYYIFSEDLIARMANYMD
ncbi:MAG: hypothetical protein GY865_02125 [candidate division Zixibacteria bacterium]|nr:hypothetical protein [candidate division Zixibacteria bacterium]